MVINTEQKIWKPINAFYGKAFFENSTDYSKTTKNKKRVYFKFAFTKTINDSNQYGYLKPFEINFDETTKIFSYKKPNKEDKELKIIKAKWENKIFKIDDYYIRQDVYNRGLPEPSIFD